MSKYDVKRVGMHETETKLNYYFTATNAAAPELRSARTRDKPNSGVE